MQIGFNTNGLQSHRLLDALHLLADHGYRAVALTLDTMHLDPLTATAAAIDECARLLDRLGLGVVIETGARFALDPARKHEPTLMTDDPDGVARRVDFYRRCAEIGAALGAQVVSFWAGTDHRPGPTSQVRLDDGVTAACEAIRGAGLVPALEPEPGMALETVTEYRTLTERLDPRLGAEVPALVLDIGHLYVTGEGEPGEVIPGIADRLVQVHLEDMRRGVHEHLPPGEGDVDFAAVRRALTASGYSGPVCFELSRSSHVAPTMLERCLKAWRLAEPHRST